MEKYNPAIVMLPASHNGRDLAGRVSARRGVGLVADCSSVELTEDKADIKWIRPSFDGKLFCDVRILSETMMATIGRGSFVEAPRDEKREVEIIKEEAGLSQEDVKTKFIDFEKADINPLLDKLLNSKVVVSGGRGLGGPENWHLVEPWLVRQGLTSWCNWRPSKTRPMHCPWHLWSHPTHKGHGKFCNNYCHQQ